jgi:hypothetical protein
LLPHERRDSMGAKDQFGAGGDFIDPLYKTNTPPGKILDYIPVVNDFMKHVNRCAMSSQGPFHSLHGHLHASTVSTWLSYDDFTYRRRHASSL